MGWKEIRRDIPDLPSDFVKGDWPTPHKTEFWKKVSFEQVFPLLIDQYRQLAEMSPEVRQAIAGANALFPTLSDTIESDDIGRVIGGSMRYYLLKKLAIPQEDIDKPLHYIVTEYKDIGDLMADWAPEMRALAYYEFWVSEFKRLENADPDTAESQDHIPYFLHKSLGLTIPTTIVKKHVAQAIPEPQPAAETEYTGINYQGVFIPVETMIRVQEMLLKKPRQPARQLQIADYLISGETDYEALAAALGVTYGTVRNAAAAFLSRCASVFMAQQAAERNNKSV